MAPRPKGKTEAALVREALKEVIKERGFRQADLEERLGKPQGHLSHLFAGRVKLSVEQLFEMLEAIGVKPDDFFFRVFAPDELKADQLEATLLRTLQRLAKDSAKEGGAD